MNHSTKLRRGRRSRSSDLALAAVRGWFAGMGRSTIDWVVRMFWDN